MNCNWCGESCNLGPLGDKMGEGGLLDAEVIGGYNSTPGNGAGALDDCVAYSFSLCEFCLDHLFTLFQNPPTVSDLHDGQESWRPAPQRVKSDEWRQSKDAFFNEFHYRNAARARNR